MDLSSIGQGSPVLSVWSAGREGRIVFAGLLLLVSGCVSGWSGIVGDGQAYPTAHDGPEGRYESLCAYDRDTEGSRCFVSFPLNSSPALKMLYGPAHFDQKSGDLWFEHGRTGMLFGTGVVMNRGRMTLEGMRRVGWEKHYQDVVGTFVGKIPGNPYLRVFAGDDVVLMLFSGVSKGMRRRLDVQGNKIELGPEYSLRLEDSSVSNGMRPLVMADLYPSLRGVNGTFKSGGDIEIFASAVMLKREQGSGELKFYIFYGPFQLDAPLGFDLSLREDGQRGARTAYSLKGSAPVGKSRSVQDVPMEAVALFRPMIERMLSSLEAGHAKIIESNGRVVSMVAPESMSESMLVK